MESDMEMETMDQPLLEDTSASLGEGDRVGRVQVSFFKVGGMTCSACVSTIESFVGSLEGVEAVSVTLLTERMQVKYDRKKVTPKAIVEATEEIGFTAVEEDKSDIVLMIGGMTCGACVNTVESVLRATPGVASASVNLLTGKAKVTFGKNAVAVRDLIESIEEVGFQASVSKDKKMTLDVFRKLTEIEYYWRSLWTAVAFNVVFLLVMALHQIPKVHMWFETRLAGAFTIGVLFEWVLATPVNFWVGRKIHVGAVKALLHRTFTMDVLLSLGCNAAYFYSVIVVFVSISDPKYHAMIMFETPVMVITFVMLGRFLENSAKAKTTDAISRLFELRVDKVNVVEATPEGEVIREKSMDVELAKIGDLIRVKPGEQIPLDGVLELGTTSVDESCLTGEPQLVGKKSGDEVFGGTLNYGGLVLVRVSRVGADSTLNQIIALVEEAQTKKAPIQFFADRVSAVFVPTIIGISMAVFLVWFVLASTVLPRDWVLENDNFLFAFLFGVAVLMIACPCALGLATPTAVMVGTGVGASLGILIKGAAVFEQLSQISVCVFDKTGTLTEGRPAVASWQLRSASLDAARAMALLASAERHAAHPVGAALRRFAVSQLPPRAVLFEPSSLTEDMGAGGVKCIVDGVRVSVGTAEFVGTAKEEEEEDGRSSVYLCVDDNIVCEFRVCDAERADSEQVVRWLHERQVKTAMVTGDREAVAKKLARKLGISTVYAGMKPHQKLNLVMSLQEQGERVMVIGDGINDSPALAKADVGIAIGSSAPVAVQAADIVLMRNTLSDLVTAIDLSQTVFRRIRLNFLFAFMYNVVGVPLAAGLLYPLIRPMSMPPSVCALAMALSSTTVVFSSLLLKKYRPPKM